MEENKKTSHKGFKLFIIIFLILSIFLLKKENQNKIVELFDSIGNKEKVLWLTNSFKNDGDIENINIYDDNIVKWSNNKISFMKTDGKIILEKGFEFTDPSIYFGKNNIYVVDKSTGDIYFLDKNGETIDRIKLNKEIYNLKESNANLIYHIKSPNQENISILNKENLLIGNYSYDNENILTFVVSKNGTTNAVSVLNFNEEILKSKLEIYGQNNEKLNSLDIEGEIVLFLEFTSNEDLIALTDRALYSIKEGKIKWKKQYDLIKDIYLEDEKIYILYSNYLESIYLDGRTENKIGFTEEYKKILPFGRKILLYGDNNITILEGDRQILKHNENMQRVFTSNNKIFVLSSDEILLYELKNKK